MSDLIDRQYVIDALEHGLENDYVDATELLAYVKQLPSVKLERMVKVYKKQAPDRLYYFYCGFCGEMIDCSFYEDYKSIKSYCGYCGAKLDWSE